MGFWKTMSELARRAQMLFSRRARFDHEMEEEMRLHQELRARELEEAGADAEEARHAAQRKFGNTLRMREEAHRAWGWTWIDDLLQDLRYGMRRLRHSPGFTTVAVLTLALGIGANTAIFTLVQQVMLNPLPVAHAHELYSLGDDKTGCCGGGLMGDFSVYSYPLYQYLRNNTPEFTDLAAFMAGSVSLGVRRSGDANPSRSFRGEFVSGNYFSMLGVEPISGRVLTPADDRSNAPPQIVLSYRAWHDKFAADPHLVGSTLILKGLPVTVAGVTPPEFFGDTLTSDPPDIWMPLEMERMLNPRASLLDHWNEHWLYAIGRLRSGANPAQVQAHVTAELQQWLRENYIADRYNSDQYLAARYTKEIPKQHIVVVRAAGGVVSTRDNNRQMLRLLTIVSVLVLLIACANIASLLLARSAAGRLQTAVRLALGASRSRIVRQTLTEGILLALLGGAAGVWMAMPATRGILLLAFGNADYIPIHTGPSALVLGFAFFLSLLTGLLFSAAPAWMGARMQPADPMRGAGRSTADGSGFQQKSMVVVQAAISLVLLIGAGLLTISLRHMERRPFGIDPHGRLTAFIDVPRNQYPYSRLENLYQQIQQQFARIPGVVSASFSNSAPMSGGIMLEPISIEGKPPVPKLEHGIWPAENRVSAHYFETVGTRVLRGRAINEHDTDRSQHVAVIDEAFARFFFPNEDPIGKHFGVQTEKHSHDYEIVGIVQNAQYANPKIESYPTFFLPLLQAEQYEDTAEELEQADSRYANNIQLHVAGRPEDFAEAVRRTLADIDPNITVISTRSLAEQVGRNFNQERLVARLTTLYGLLALLLAAVGLYGVAGYAAARRVKEIGIRMAVGADRKDVLALMLRGAMAPIALGIVIGIPAALIGGRAISSQLYGVKSYDPVIITGAAAVLALFGIMAAFLPARRAASIDPMQALRTE